MGTEQALIIIFPLVVCDKAKGTMKLHLEVQIQLFFLFWDDKYNFIRQQ